jgi:transmembrane sensor
MSGERGIQGAGTVAEEAVSWFARLQGEAATGDDWLAFERWLQASPTHADAYDRLERLWVELEADGAAIEAALDAPPASAAPRVRPGISRRTWLAAGSALAASVAVGVFVNQPRPPPAVVYQTAPGETRQISLADGTRIHLNADSRISVRLEQHVRRVEMADAEAAFDVAHDPARPFVISVGDREVRVVGTEFNLRRRNGKIALTMRRGVVEVRPAGGAPGKPIQLTQGQHLVHREGAPESTLARVEPNAAFAWTVGQLVYSDRPLSEVVEDVSRRLGAQVRVADRRTGALRFSGVLVVDDEASVIRRLEAFLPVKASWTPNGVVLSAAS